MHNTVKTFFARLYVLLFTFTLLGCNSKKMDEKIILLSEPMQNRFVDDGKSPKHDKDCIAFNKTHFNPSLVIAEYFTNENYKRLAKITGLNWTKQIINDSVLDFTHYFSDNINKAIYVSEIVSSDKAEQKYITAGSDDGFVLWVNGDSVFSFHKGNAILPEDYIIPIKLKEGNNILLYKIDQGDGGWAFCRKIISKEELGQRIRDKVNILYTDLPESCIISDNSLYLPLKPDHRRKLDYIHNVELIWLDKDHKEISKESYKCSKMPS